MRDGYLCEKCYCEYRTHEEMRRHEHKHFKDEMYEVYEAQAARVDPEVQRKDSRDDLLRLLGELEP